MPNRLAEISTRLSRLEAENEWLRAALKPFIVAAKDANGYPDTHPIGCDPCIPLDGLTVGDLRRALAHEQEVTNAGPK